MDTWHKILCVAPGAMIFLLGILEKIYPSKERILWTPPPEILDGAGVVIKKAQVLSANLSIIVGMANILFSVAMLALWGNETYLVSLLAGGDILLQWAKGTDIAGMLAFAFLVFSYVLTHKLLSAYFRRNFDRVVEVEVEKAKAERREKANAYVIENKIERKNVPTRVSAARERKFTARIVFAKEKSHNEEEDEEPGMSVVVGTRLDAIDFTPHNIELHLYLHLRKNITIKIGDKLALQNNKTGELQSWDKIDKYSGVCLNPLLDETITACQPSWEGNLALTFSNDMVLILYNEPAEGNTFEIWMNPYIPPPIAFVNARTTDAR